MESVVHWLARVIEAVGIAVIVGGALLATLALCRRLVRREGFTGSYQRYRADLGRAILLGLEFLVAGDIIGTVVVDPTFRNLGVLGLIVLIRTFLSFSLEVEISGRLPWRKSADSGSGGDRATQ